MSEDWNTNMAPARIRRDPPTLEEQSSPPAAFEDQRQQQARSLRAEWGCLSEGLAEWKKTAARLRESATA